MLQGSLDNFSLDEVLGLLASTAKSGNLEVKGDRGSGSLGLQQGQLVGAAASNSANGTGIEDVVFELMRFSEGNFAFSPVEVEAQHPARLIPDVLAAAENRLADWRAIEVVVPSLSHIVTPVPTLPDDEITIDRREWSTLIVIGAGCPVSVVCSELDLGEVEGSRQIKNLAERGLVSIGPPSKTGNGFVARSRGDSHTPTDPFGRQVQQQPVQQQPVQHQPVQHQPVQRSEPGMAPASPSELAGTVASSARELVGAGAAVGGADMAASMARPPMPAAPNMDDLRQAESATPTAGLGTPLLDTPDSAAPAVSTPGFLSEPAKPGGLLMRYLKGED